MLPESDGWPGYRRQEWDNLNILFGQVPTSLIHGSILHTSCIALSKHISILWHNVIANGAGQPEAINRYLILLRH